MQIPDYSHLELSLYQKFIVRTLPILKSSIFYRKKSISLLCQYELIHRVPRILFGHYVYEPTDFGKMYFRYKRNDHLRFLIPTTISIIALLEAYDVLTIPFLRDTLQAIGTLLKSTLGSLGVFH